MSDDGLWKRLIEARTEAGLSTKQVDIAKDADVTEPAVTKWKRHGGSMELSTAAALAQSARVSVDWLLTGRGPKRPINTGTPLYELLLIFEKLCPEVQNEVLQFAKFRSQSK